MRRYGFAQASRRKCHRIFEQPGACSGMHECIMKQESEIRNAVVSAWESSVSTAAALKVDRPLHIVHGRRDRFQLSHALHNYVGILQAVSGHRANNPALFRDFFE